MKNTIKIVLLAAYILMPFVANYGEIPEPGDPDFIGPVQHEINS